VPATKQTNIAMFAFMALVNGGNKINLKTGPFSIFKESKLIKTTDNKIYICGFTTKALFEVIKMETTDPRVSIQWFGRTIASNVPLSSVWLPIFMSYYFADIQFERERKKFFLCFTKYICNWDVLGLEKDTIKKFNSLI